MRVFFSNLGCKLNQAELEAQARRFHGAGHEVVAQLEDADLHVINSCTVTHVAARQSRQEVRRGKKLKAEIKTVLTGCYASHPEGVESLPEEVDLVVPNAKKEQLLEWVEAAFPQPVPKQRAVDEVPIPYVPLEFGNTRALVKVEDGCNMSCSFCIIPTTRGRQRSRPAAECVEEVRALVAGGYREVVVTGVQISAYRHGSQRLYDLVKQLLEETEVERLRLTSIAPWQFDERLLDLFASGRLCRHFHLSLQSGCDETLRRMRRPYTSEQFGTLAARLREAVPGVAITTDVIVGFPGETAVEFEASLRFLRTMSFTKAHVFPYSVREGTRAAALEDRVEPGEVALRAARMREAALASEAQFLTQQLGQTVEVLWEGRRHGLWRGLTDNYLRVTARSARSLSNQRTRTRLRRVEKRAVFGEIEQEQPHTGVAARPRPAGIRSTG
jgi:threonylcarbamoyladenosine tRNA methylthiotransferase MtaB